MFSTKSNTFIDNPNPVWGCLALCIGRRLCFNRVASERVHFLVLTSKEDFLLGIIGKWTGLTFHGIKENPGEGLLTIKDCLGGLNKTNCLAKALYSIIEVGNLSRELSIIGCSAGLSSPGSFNSPGDNLVILWLIKLKVIRFFFGQFFFTTIGQDL